MGRQETRLHPQTKRFYSEVIQTAVRDEEARALITGLRGLLPAKRRLVKQPRHFEKLPISTDQKLALDLVQLAGKTIADGERRTTALSAVATYLVFGLLCFDDSSMAGHPWVFFRSSLQHDKGMMRETHTSRGYGIDITMMYLTTSEQKDVIVATVARSGEQARRRGPGSVGTSGRLAA